MESGEQKQNNKDLIINQEPNNQQNPSQNLILSNNLSVGYH